MKKIIVILIFFPIFCLCQDSNFSGRYASREYINPSLSSNYKGSEQASIIYKRQWSSLGSEFPFQSYALNINKKIEWEDTNEFSANLRIMKDLAPGSSFSQNHIVLGANYKKLLTERFGNAQFLSLGFSGGLGQNKANWEGLWFGNQYDFETNNPDLNISSGESTDILLNSISYPDLNIGASYEMHKPEFSFIASLSLQHLNMPNTSFIPNFEIRTERKISALLSFNFLMRENLYFIFAPYYTKQGVFHQASTKIGLAFSAADDYEINFGIATAPTIVQNFEGLGFESLSLQVFFEKRAFRFEFAYDATISKLSSFNNGRGAFEFSFTYTRKAYKKKSSFVRYFHHL